MVSYRKFEQIVDSDDEEEEISTSTMKATPAPGRQPAPKPPPPKAPELPSSMSPSLKNAVLEAFAKLQQASARGDKKACLLYTSPSPRDRHKSRIPSSA